MRVVELPSPLPEGAKFLHIGLPKSGTTAVQGALHDARAQLADLGVHNVSRRRNELAVGRRAVGVLEAFQTEAGKKRWPVLATDFRNSQARCTVWSSEPLSAAKPEAIANLARVLGEDLHIVITVRPIASMVRSGWQQGLRRGRTESLEEFLVGRLPEVGSDPNALRRYNLPRLAREWGAVFGEDRITFIVADRDDPLRSLRAFEALMGVPEMLKPAAETNRSLPYPEAELLRSFNQANQAQGGDPIVRGRSISTLGLVGMREVAQMAQPASIAMPRWAAERANAYVEAWLPELEATQATVAGSLEDLLVDPETFAEAPVPPSQVSIDTAGRFMEVVYDAALRYNARSVPTKSVPPPAPAVTTVPAKELVRELRRRVKRRLTR